MSYVDIKGKFHIALDGVGLLLQGSPAAPAYRMTNAPVYGTRFASGDRDYNDLSQWWYLIQTDWSGGVKESISFEDDAKFYYSTNIDARSKPGSLMLEKTIVEERDNTSNSEKCLDVHTAIYNGNDVLHYFDSGEVRSVSTGNVVGAFSGDPIHHINYKGYYWVSGSGGSVENFDGTTTSNKTSQINGVAGVGTIATTGATNAFAVVGDALYVLGRTTTGELFCVHTTVANPSASGDWTLDFYVGISEDVEICGIDVLGGEIVILLENANGLGTGRLYSFDIASAALTLLREFPSQQTGVYQRGMRYVRTFSGKCLITVGSPSGQSPEGSIYAYDGSSITKIYETTPAKIAIGNQASAYLQGGCVVAGDYAYWGNLVYDGTSFFNFIKTEDDDVTYSLIPIGFEPSTNKLYLADDEVVSGDDQIIIYSYEVHSTSYKTGASNSAFAVFSQHDKLQSIEKLLNQITIGFAQFASGQSISIYYTTAPTPPTANGSWTLLGTASYTLDGASVTSKQFNFPVGTTAKKIWFRAELVSDGTNTPELTDFTLEYLPMPEYKKQWALNLNCADEVKRLDGRLVETTARELKSRLERMWWTKSALDFQDVDYATTLVNDASFDATETTITVDSTADFPEQGRIRVDDEEILYTNKTPTTFTGCTRGARGTRASTHADNAVVNNAYRVIITEIDERIPIYLEDNLLEYITGLSIREV